MRRIRKKIYICIWVVAALAGLWLLQRLVTPKYMGDVREGAMIAEYYQEEKNHDVVFVGDCELYENISPVVLWEKYGINSYIRGSAQQLIWQSYYLIEETLTYETPEVIVFNVLSMKYDEPQNEAYNRMTLDGMKLSASKINAVQASMTEEESLVEYLFPILRYHSRITELTGEDIRYLFRRDTVTHNGYYMTASVKAVDVVPQGKPLSDYEFGENAYSYLDKMVELCESEGVELVLVKAPSLYPYWYEEWDAQIASYAEEHGLKYYNFLDCVEDIGLDYQTDTYDGGLHLNVYGAEKLADYFGNILATECGIESRRGEEELERIWQEKTEAYNEEKTRLESEFAEKSAIQNEKNIVK